MEIKSERILASLLNFAYITEWEEQEIIYYALKEIPPGDDWDVLMKIMKDNEIHKEMLKELIKDLVNKEPEYQMNLRDFSGFDRNKLIEMIAKSEKFAYLFYLYLKRNIKLDESKMERVNKTLEKLVSWEKQHISLVEKLLKNFGIRYKIL